jgi:hypothetical protein
MNYTKTLNKIAKASVMGLTNFPIIISYIKKALPNHILSFHEKIDSADVFLVLKDNHLFHDEGRYLYIIVKTIALKFPQIVINQFDLKSYYNLGKYGRSIYEIKGILFTNNMPKITNGKILLYDSTLSKKVNWTGKSICLEFNASRFRPDSQNFFLMPYPMHPHIYEKSYLGKIYKLRRAEKAIHILFAGRTNPELYSGQGIFYKQNANLMPRSKAISSIKKEFYGQYISIESHSDLAEALEYSGNRKFVLSEKSCFSIPRKDWLLVLAKCSFFICLPGVDMPLCHNSIEAMSVGTIPLINYGDWFEPKLTHLHNCIQFRGESDLTQKINLILSLPSDKIKELRENVITYYENHLNLNNFYEKVIGDDNRESTIFVNMNCKIKI